MFLVEDGLAVGAGMNRVLAGVDTEGDEAASEAQSEEEEADTDRPNQDARLVCNRRHDVLRRRVC